ncbi:uncharacterized protein BO66DRAFT_398942 [Aspergillus aculeatinus CBS 121060]|uniref:Uncharacterized protein n=1 Tax=Aspergillus aculeatinus CBS 121060 TaxID=1448322 RepID=A0ACD1HI21_9EURO|nr:hypothetical protein BO66DRAFT_398942 [Aspergillus aculeatinus CBS 121060]RAH73161.1 hypothetical protein BO66DRAFT_398942 [Aspergillus aculeatinus CBS 121060]
MFGSEGSLPDYLTRFDTGIAPESESSLSTDVLDHSSEEVSLEDVIEELHSNKPVHPTMSFTPSTKCSTRVEKLGYAPSNAGYDARRNPKFGQQAHEPLPNHRSDELRWVRVNCDDKTDELAFSTRLDAKVMVLLGRSPGPSVTPPSRSGHDVISQSPSQEKVMRKCLVTSHTPMTIYRITSTTQDRRMIGSLHFVKTGYSATIANPHKALSQKRANRAEYRHQKRQATAAELGSTKQVAL